MQIHTLKHNTSEISFSPLRWWIITSIKLKSDEILFLNEETFNNPEKNVRWWIPIMFPNAGPLRENSLYNLNQHWFARNKAWDYEISDREVKMTLSSDNETKKLYDFDFRLETIAKIIDDTKIEIIQKIINTWDKLLPISPGLHPYYFVQNDEKKDLKILLWDKYLDNYSFCNWETVYLDNPWNIKLIFPEWTEIDLNYDKSYEKLWIRSEEWKDFICVEPVARDEQALVDNPILVWVWESMEFKIEIKK